jgi:myosin heavy subunit
VIEGRSDADRFVSTCHALGLVGVGAEGQGSQEELFSALAGILHCGEVGSSVVEDDWVLHTPELAHHKYHSGWGYAPLGG